MSKFAWKKLSKLLATVGLTVLLCGMLTQTAAAAGVVLFQDDTFQDVMSDALRIGSNDSGSVNTAIQFGNDAVSSENGNITWDITTNSFSIDHAVNITGGLTSDGTVDFSSASANILRKSATPNASEACSTLGEVIVNTTTNRVEVCTVTGAAGFAVWSAPAVTVSTGLSNPLTCTVSDLFYNTSTNTLMVCTATNTWSAAGPQDFESVYAKDGDQTLTTSNGNFTVDSGSGAIGLSATSGNVNVTGGAAANNAIDLNASNAAGGITANWGTGGLNFSSSTGAFSISGSGNSSLSTDSGNLNLSTTTSGNVALTATGAGNSVTFSDANVTSPIKFSNTATALAATFTAGDGILDAINEFTSTAAGAGASNVGVATGLTNITGSDVQAALASIDSQIGSNAKKVDTLTFNPAFPNVVNAPSGSNNQGTLVAEFDATNNRQYYGWTTHQSSLQSMNIKFRFPLPTDFKSLSTVNGDTMTFNFRTGLNAATHNKLDFRLRDVTKGNTSCALSSGNFSAAANTWTSVAVTAAAINAGCTGGNALAAGDVMEAEIVFYADNTASADAQAGQVNLKYTN